MSNNVAQSVRARLARLAREKGIDMEAMLRRYVLERFLFRMSQTRWKDQYCLKGGLLIAVWNDGDMFRPTTDVDLNGFSRSGDVAQLAEMIREVASSPVDVDDGVEFDLSRMKVAKAREGIVPGGKIVFDATVDKARVRVRVDVGFGNPVTPSVEPIEYPALLDMPRPHLMAYPVTTTIAEKMHAIARHGMLNSRLKDYYDLWALLGRLDVDGETLASAIAETFSHQQEELPDGMLPGLSAEFISRNASTWDAYRSTEALAYPPPDLATVVQGLQALLQPAMERAKELLAEHQTISP